MAKEADKLGMTISEAERCERALDSMTKKLGLLATVIERMDERLGKVIPAVSGQSQESQSAPFRTS